MRPPPPLAHVGQDGADELERPADVRGEHPLEVVAALALERPDRDDAGVVDQHVDAAEVVADLADEPPHVVGVRHVAGGGEGVGRAAVYELLAGLAQLVLVAGAQGDAAAGVGELAADLQAQTAAAAGDEGDLAGQLE